MREKFKSVCNCNEGDGKEQHLAQCRHLVVIRCQQKEKHFTETFFVGNIKQKNGIKKIAQSFTALHTIYKIYNIK